MPRTTVKKHSRKGTKGVKKHSRQVNKKTVPARKSVKKRITINQLIKELNLELTQFTFFDSATSRHQDLKSFDDIPEEIRNQKWDFEVEIDRTPVDESEEFAYIKINGSRVTGKKRQAKRMGINLGKARIQPMGFETVDTYQTINIDTHMNNPIFNYDESSKDDIRRVTKKTLLSNFPNLQYLNYKWED